MPRQAKRQAAPRSAEREKLAAAISRYQAAVQAVAKAREASERAEAERIKARRTLDEAEAAVEQAKTTEGALLVETFVDGGDIGAPAAVDETTAAARQAAQRLARLRQVGETLRAAITEAEKQKEYASWSLRDAIADVIKAEAPVAKLLAEAQALQDKLITQRAALRYLDSNGLVAEADEKLVRSFLFKNNVLPATTGQMEVADFRHHPATEPWRAAYEALQTDADAPLPA